MKLSLSILVLFSFFLNSQTVRASTFFNNEQRVSELSFYQTINRLKIIYPSIPFISDWSNNNLEAHVSRGVVFLSGGFARKKGINLGGFLTVACHEVGHALLGLFEGEADYFASNKCMKEFFGYEDNELAVSRLDNPPKDLESLCNERFKSREEINICLRISLSSINAANLDRIRCASRLNELKEKLGENLSEALRISNHYFRCLRTKSSVTDNFFNRSNLISTILEVQSTLNTELNFLSVDNRIVSNTYTQHNSPLCRIETLINGALNLEKPRCWYK